MKSPVFRRLSDILTVTSTVGSFLALVVSITLWLGSSLEIAFAILSVLIGSIAGAYSMFLARLARRLPTSPRVFLSYSHQDSAVAHLLATKLKEAGMKVWLDADQIGAGDNILEKIEQAINESDTFVMLLSEAIRENPNLNFELGLATGLAKKIIPVLVGNATLPENLQKWRYIDLTKESEKGVSELLSAV